MTTIANVNPGDRILVAFEDHVTQEQAIEALRSLRERLPDIDIIGIGGGIENVILIPASEDESDGE